MHDSRMIAEVAPPGVCAMPKVSGSRMATPLAPPSPGSTPISTPRITPTNMRPMLIGVRATPNPCARAWISSKLVQPQPGFDGALGQRHLEPHLEDDVEHRDGNHADHGHLPPHVLPQPAHEEADEEDGRHVDADPGDEEGVDCRRDQHREHELELPDVHESLVLLRCDQQGA